MESIDIKQYIVIVFKQTKNYLIHLVQIIRKLIWIRIR